MELTILLVVGAAAGFLAGLLGIGGGLVIVPALAWLLAERAGEAAMHMAIATSLATILGTGSASVLAHHRRGAVDWPLVVRLAPALVAGSLLAAWIADRLSGLQLALLFGLFCWFAAWRLAFAGDLPELRPRPPARGGELSAIGLGIGLISALVGIGGGTLTVPYLRWRRQQIHGAVATSAACGLPIALAGAASYVVVGTDAAGLPGPRLGYVHVPAWLGIMAASVITAPLGARAAHRLPTGGLQRVFALFLVAVGALLILRA